MRFYTLADLNDQYPTRIVQALKKLAGLAAVEGLD
jgi:hypothetical protein